MGYIGLGVLLVFVDFIMWRGLVQMGEAFKVVSDNVTGGVHASDLGESWMSGAPIFIPLTVLFIGLVLIIKGVTDRGKRRGD